MIGARIAALILVAIAGSALAQPDPAALAATAGQAPDLVLPTSGGKPGFFSSPGMALYKPDGDGPFPALVLQHQCAGLLSERVRNQSMLDWAKRAVERGYVVLLIDSLGPRGVQSVCMGPQRGVTAARGVKDVLLGARHLASLRFVDARRIAVAGHSWGGRSAILAARSDIRTALVPDAPVAAAVSFYPPCFDVQRQGIEPWPVIGRDIDRPLLVLLGSRDNETPPDLCTTRLAPVQASGAPVEWHEYPDATHCWDCRQLDGFSKVDVRGSHVTYKYDDAITRDSADRFFSFLARHLPAR
jgi:dienelactone hydrolase